MNLLLSNLRRSSRPGDSADMVRARRRFLDAGAFSQLAALLQSEARDLSLQWDTSAGVDIVDAGCGEGHFLGAMEKVVSGSLFGVDVSKEAVRLAARRYRRPRWVVSNVMRRLPFARESLNMILSVLAPRNVEEFARVLKPDGFLVIVVPGPDHLIELRSRLMADHGDCRDKADATVELCAPRFVLRQRKPIVNRVCLDGELLRDLVQMTPLFWRSTRDAKADGARLDELQVTTSFVLLTFDLAP